MAEDGGIDGTVVELLRKLHAAEERSHELEKMNELLQRRSEEARDEIEALKNTRAFLRAHNDLLVAENHILTGRLDEFERRAARHVDELIESSVEMIGVVARKKTALQAFLEANGFSRTSVCLKASVVYADTFLDGISALDKVQVDIVKRAIHALVNKGYRGTASQNHREVERPMDGIPAPVGSRMSSASKRLRYFWKLEGEGTERKLTVFYVQRHR